MNSSTAKWKQGIGAAQGVHQLRGTSGYWQTSDIAAEHKRPHAVTALTKTQRGMASRIHVLRRLTEHGAASSCTLNEAMN